MRKRNMLLLFVLAAGLLCAAESRYICKVSHLSVTEASVSCLNGATPHTSTVGDTLIVSCSAK